MLGNMLRGPGPGPVLSLSMSNERKDGHRVAYPSVAHLPRYGTAYRTLGIVIHEQDINIIEEQESS